MPADLKDDDFSIIERLADAIRIEDEVHENTEDRERLVKDLYEGPRKCQCCVNWVNDKPVPIEVVPVVPEPEDFTHPLIVRHRLLPTAIRGAKRLEIHSIEVRHPQVREVLYKVFRNLDNIVPMVRYLVLRAPFRQFFWRWAKFEQAIEEQESEVIKEILVQLRALVRTHLAEAFAVSEELTSHGIINFKYIWTLFPPGELVYERHNDSLNGQFHIVTSVATPEQERLNRYGINCLYTDWSGYGFGSRHIRLDVVGFIGTRQIHLLEVVPAKYLPDFEMRRQLCLERGRKFHQFAGLTYKAYIPSKFDAEDGDDETGRGAKKDLSTRIILDSTGHPAGHSRRNIASPMMPLVNLERLCCTTMLISQAPVDQEPPGGHRPLHEDRDENSSPNDWMRNNRGARGPPRPAQQWSPQRPPGQPAGMMPPPPPMRRPTAQRVIVYSDTESDSDDEYQKEELTELQLVLCNSRMPGYSLKDKAWRTFDVDRICDIEPNEEPFDSLVLPEGYKDLILSFVENQLRDGETFDDVINGKGGGLVILLAGSPGVGKTLTAESVAEKINAPLVKVELASLLKEPTNAMRPRNVGATSDSEDEPDDELSNIFSQAAKWKAVLLIDECDMYLEKRLNSETHSQRNRLVARFLRELEYYPSLLFLTTNRAKVLDPAIHSRIHLTINYPPLDAASRLAIWRTFLGREGSGCIVTEDELRVLSEVETNGRRIKNITKTARVMAKRKGRGVTFMELRDVMRITEGLVLPVPGLLPVQSPPSGFAH